jgi:hypothetical protein
MYGKKLVICGVYIQPFKEYKNYVQKDKASLYCVLSCFDGIKNHFNSTEIPEAFQEIKDTTLNLIEKNGINISIKISLMYLIFLTLIWIKIHSVR